MASDIHRILIADDDERPRQLLAHYLKNWGYTVVACADGLEADAILASDSPPSLALIDWNMPGLEGVELCRRIRARAGRRPYIYVILVTGNTRAAEGLEAGADDFVAKPYDVEELRARLAVGKRVVALERRLAEHNEQLREALDQIGQLQDIAPMCVCPSCHRARDAKVEWQPLETFLHNYRSVPVASEICPDCEAAGEQSARDTNPLRKKQEELNVFPQPDAPGEGPPPL